MKKINYISNLDVNIVSGGWSSFNKNVFDLLKTFTPVHVVDAINPPFPFAQRVISKVQRFLKMPALFPAYSQYRLRKIARIVESRLGNDSELNFYHGSTPWVLVKNELPYVCYLDASFSTYLSIYHRGVNFNSGKIIALEKIFFQNAKAVFFSSKYSLEQTKDVYRLVGENFHVAGLGGNLDYSEPLPIFKRNRFIFIGHDFYGKGGELVAEAFKQFNQKHPGFHLIFMGGEPPPRVLEIPGVEYIGFLDKRKENELLRYKELLMTGIALVLPTNRDMTPLVIIEAGYCGCPSIATNAYGIPEMIGTYGSLCDQPINVNELATAMESMLTKKNDQEMIRDFYVKNFTWPSACAKIKSVLNNLE